MRQIRVYKRFFLDFYEKQDQKIQEKIEWTLGLIRDLERIPTKFFKKLSDSDGLFEVRVEYEGNNYRIMAFFDDGNIIILGNSFHKKTQKTPNSEISKALKIKKDYFNEKG